MGAEEHSLVDTELSNGRTSVYEENFQYFDMSLNEVINDRLSHDEVLALQHELQMWLADIGPRYPARETTLLNLILGLISKIPGNKPKEQEATESLVVSKVDTIVSNDEDDQIQKKEELDRTHDVFARIDSLEKTKFIKSQPSRVLKSELRVSSKMMGNFRRALSTLGGEKVDVWLVIFNDVALRCQLTGTITLPMVSSAAAGVPGGRASPNNSSGRRVPLRNMYKFIKVEWMESDSSDEELSATSTEYNEAQLSHQEDCLRFHQSTIYGRYVAGRARNAIHDIMALQQTGVQCDIVLDYQRRTICLRRTWIASRRTRRFDALTPTESITQRVREDVKFLKEQPQVLKEVEITG
ncbi:hypothetical protein BKA62DRAFT_673079 [Auriculariales sp. MPI-PUGE-AT-0066]|nr:hypothetical protein BKA62DRAFT_673079 [Auriculariales sp. MPI-PUGE-AT-0066]